MLIQRNYTLPYSQSFLTLSDLVPMNATIDYKYAIIFTGIEDEFYLRSWMVGVRFFHF